MGFDSSLNGCGACNGFWKWFKPPHHKFFKVQCNIHDISYAIGGQEIDRHIADVKLKYNMKDWVNVYFENRKPIYAAEELIHILSRPFGSDIDLAIEKAKSLMK